MVTMHPKQCRWTHAKPKPRLAFIPCISYATHVVKSSAEWEYGMRHGTSEALAPSALHSNNNTIWSCYVTLGINGR